MLDRVGPRHFRRPLRHGGMAIALVLALLVVGCAGRPGPDSCQNSELQVAANGQVLPWVEGPVPADDPSAGRHRTLELLAERYDVTASPYVPLAARVEVTVGTGVTSTVVQETPIAADGAVRWKGWQEVRSRLARTSLTFEVPENLATLFSSDSADYEPGSSIRGVVLTITCEGNPRQYGFAFRTDPPLMR